MTLPDPVRELERWMHSIRGIRGRLVDLDARERWGHPSEEELSRMARVTADLEEEKKRQEAFVIERVRLLRREDPASIAAWVQAHQTLLEDCMARGDDTARFLAERELQHWQELLEGQRDLVSENTSALRIDPALFRELFGSL